MVEFQINKKKDPSPNSSKDVFQTPKRLSFQNQLIKPPNQTKIINLEILKNIRLKQQPSTDRSNSSKSSQFTELAAVFRSTKRNFRNTSCSFFKKSTKPTNQEVFRNTAISFKKTNNKNTYFDNLLSDTADLKEYKVLGQIGKGSFSTVFSAIHKETQKQVAIKIYEKINSLCWTRLEGIKREIQSLKKITGHQNIVNLYHVIKDKNKLYLVMQKCGKQTLSGLLRKSKILEEKKIKKYFIQIVEAVSYFHNKGVCHRDLKPQNILIDHEDNIKIIDFGFSAGGNNFLTTHCGTPPFMCPEIIQKRAYSGMKADIWALGVILFLMTNGKLPFRATTEQQLYRLIGLGKPQFSEEFNNEKIRKLIDKMLKVNCEQRINALSLMNQKWLKKSLTN